MEPLAIVAIVGITVTAAWMMYLFRRKSMFTKLAKSSSNQSLAEMVPEDPIQVSA